MAEENREFLPDVNKKNNDLKVERNEEKEIPEPELVSGIEGFVSPDWAFPLPQESFSLRKEVSVLEDLDLRPVVLNKKGEEMIRGIYADRVRDKIINPDKIEIVDEEQDVSPKRVKVTAAMGKACFIEKPLAIEGENYDFVQWKGVGLNPAAENLKNRVETMRVLQSISRILL